MDKVKHPHHQKHWEEVMAMFKEHAAEKYAMYPTCHPSIEHSFTVLMEEVTELGDEIYKKPRYRDYTNLMEEALDVAHCALRMLVDCKCRESEGLSHSDHYAKA